MRPASRHDPVNSTRGRSGPEATGEETRLARIWKFLAIILVLAFLAAPGQARAASLRAVFPSGPGSLDPHQNPDPWAWTYIFPCYQRLTAFKGALTEVVPSLAATWRISEDGRLYTVVIKEGYTFSDGRPVDAEAVRLSFARAYRIGPAFKTFFPTLGRIETLGPMTVRFTLSKPSPYFLQSLATAPASIVSPGVVEKPPGYLDRNTLGSGLYTGLVEKDRIVLTARTDQTFKPEITSFEGVIRPEHLDELEMLRGRRVEIAAGLGQAQLGILSEDPDLTDYSITTLTGSFLAFNCRRPFLSKAETRRALAQSINLEALISRVHGEAAGRSFGPIPVGMQGQMDKPPGLDFDPEAAKSILDEAGRPEKPLVLVYGPDYPWRVQEAEFIKQSLEAVGLEVETREVLPAETGEVLRQGKYDLVLGLSRPMVAEAGFLLAQWFGPGNMASYGDKEMDGLLEAALIPDKERRLELYQQIQKKALEESPYVWLYQLDERVGLSRRVKNFSLHPALPTVYPLADMKLAEPPIRKPKAPSSQPPSSPPVRPAPETPLPAPESGTRGPVEKPQGWSP